MIFVLCLRAARWLLVLCRQKIFGVTVSSLSSTFTGSFAANFTGVTSGYIGSVDALWSSLAGNVYNDVNNDGIMQSGEAGIPSVAVALTGTDIRWQSRFGEHGPPIASALTPLCRTVAGNLHHRRDPTGGPARRRRHPRELPERARPETTSFQTSRWPLASTAKTTTLASPCSCNLALAASK